MGGGRVKKPPIWAPLCGLRGRARRPSTRPAGFGPGRHEMHVFDVTVDGEPLRARRVLGSCDAVLPACEDDDTLAWLAATVPGWGVPLLFDAAAYEVTSVQGSVRASSSRASERRCPRRGPPAGSRRWSSRAAPAAAPAWAGRLVRGRGVATGSRGLRRRRRRGRGRAVRRRPVACRFEVLACGRHGPWPCSPRARGRCRLRLQTDRGAGRRRAGRRRRHGRGSSLGGAVIPKSVERQIQSIALTYRRRYSVSTA